MSGWLFRFSGRKDNQIVLDTSEEHEAFAESFMAANGLRGLPVQTFCLNKQPTARFPTSPVPEVENNFVPRLRHNVGNDRQFQINASRHTAMVEEFINRTTGWPILICCGLDTLTCHVARLISFCRRNGSFLMEITAFLGKDRDDIPQVAPYFRFRGTGEFSTYHMAVIQSKDIASEPQLSADIQELFADWTYMQEQKNSRTFTQDQRLIVRAGHDSGFRRRAHGISVQEEVPSRTGLLVTYLAGRRCLSFVPNSC